MECRTSCRALSWPARGLAAWLPIGLSITLVFVVGCLVFAGPIRGVRPMTIFVTSPAFADQDRIPVRFTGDGQDVSPPLAWDNLPEGTKELALICDDPDAPTDEPWVHWVIYKIPANATGLPENVPKLPRLKNGDILQGQNSWSTPSRPSIGYRGPLPPRGDGDHRYQFTLYALSGKLIAKPGVTKEQLLAEMEGHILATGQLVGLYSR